MARVTYRVGISMAQQPQIYGDGPEALVWASTTPCYFRFISDRKYRALRPYARKWYRPVCPCLIESVRAEALAAGA